MPSRDLGCAEPERLKAALEGVSEVARMLSTLCSKVEGNKLRR
jgi:hypothetical protein